MAAALLPRVVGDAGRRFRFVHQFNGRDELPIPAKVKLDAASVAAQSPGFDLKIILPTCVKVLRRDGIVR